MSKNTFVHSTHYCTTSREAEIKKFHTVISVGNETFRSKYHLTESETQFLQAALNMLNDKFLVLGPEETSPFPLIKE